jgi:hypothetical protein
VGTYGRAARQNGRPKDGRLREVLTRAAPVSGAGVSIVRKGSKRAARSHHICIAKHGVFGVRCAASKQDQWVNADVTAASGAGPASASAVSPVGNRYIPEPLQR